jgi:hypothetical protein
LAITTRASVSEWKNSWFSSSSRIEPSNRSKNPFC